MADVSILNLNGTNYSIKDATARATANSANSTAQEAKSAADSAKSTAQAAQTTANNALDRTYDITYTQNTETINFTKYDE